MRRLSFALIGLIAGFFLGSHDLSRDCQLTGKFAWNGTVYNCSEAKPRNTKWKGSHERNRLNQQLSGLQ